MSRHTAAGTHTHTLTHTHTFHSSTAHTTRHYAAHTHSLTLSLTHARTHARTLDTNQTATAAAVRHSRTASSILLNSLNQPTTIASSSGSLLATRHSAHCTPLTLPTPLRPQRASHTPSGHCSQPSSAASHSTSPRLSLCRACPDHTALAAPSAPSPLWLAWLARLGWSTVRSAGWWAQRR